MDRKRKYKENFLDKAFLNQPYVYQLKVVKDLKDSSKVQSFLSPHKGFTCLIITNVKNYNLIPWKNGVINFNYE